MKNIKIICLILSMGAVLMVSSCKDDGETPSQFTTDDAKQSMSDFSSDLHTDIVEMTEASGVDAIGDLVTLINLNDPFGGRMMNEDEVKGWFKRNARLFKSIFVSKSVGFSRTQDEGFNFQDNWGEYHWDPQKGEFVKADHQVQMIIINFPSEGSSTNNVKLRLTDYDEQFVEDDEAGYYMPTSLVADLAIDGTVQISLDFNAAYLSDGTPTSGSASVFLNPFTFTVSFDDSADMRSTGSASIVKGDEVIVAIDLTIDYLSSAKNDFDDVSGQIQYRNMIIKGMVDIDGIDNVSDPDPNDYVSLALYDDVNQVGDIVFVTEMVDDSEEDVPYVKYPDGSQEKLEDILKPVIDEIDDFSDEVESWGD